MLYIIVDMKLHGPFDEDQYQEFIDSDAIDWDKDDVIAVKVEDETHVWPVVK